MKDLLKKFTSHSLARGSAIVFAGTMISNVGAYLYHLVIGRILGPVGYGELSSLISLLYIFGVPTLVLQTVLVKYFSTCKAHGSPGQAHFLYKRMFRTLLTILVPSFIVFSLFSPMISEFLNISGSRVIIWVFFLFIFSTLSALNGSALQGFQLFLWVAVLSGGSAILRLGISIPFAYYGVEMTMIASVLLTVVMYGLYFIPIRFLFRAIEKPMALTKKDIIRYSIPTFFTLLGMTALYSVDIVLVKHYLSAYDAGIYSAVAVLGKIIFYASSAIGMVLFPVVSERFANKKETFSIIRLAIGLVAAASLSVTFVYIVFPGTVTHLLFGTSFDAAASYLGIFAVFITIYSIVNVIIQACLAIEKMKVYLFTTSAAVAQIVLIAFFHQSLISIIYINISVLSALLISVGTYYWYGQNKHNYSGI